MRGVRRRRREEWRDEKGEKMEGELEERSGDKEGKHMKKGKVENRELEMGDKIRDEGEEGGISE